MPISYVNEGGSTTPAEENSNQGQTSYSDEYSGFDMYSTGIDASKDDYLNGENAQPSFLDNITGAVKNIGSGIIGALPNAASLSRLASAGLTNVFAGASFLKSTPVPSWASNTPSGIVTTKGIGDDWRVRVSVAPVVNFMNEVMMNPIRATNGFIFPFLPQITVTHTARYATQALTHSNYAAYSYEGSEVAEITINGEFVVQSVTDGQYLLAAIQLFRSCTKMFFGNDADAGTPPPMVWLDGFGKYYFPHVPCVVKTFTHTITPDVDYIEVPAIDGSGITRLPTQSQIQLSLQPVYSRAAVSQFNLTNFASGKLLSGENKGFI